MLGASIGNLAVAAVIVLVLPVGLAVGVRRSRKKSGPTDDEPKSADDEALLCDGVELAKARRLPRLIASRCTGSATCVEVCPYGVLEMDGKRPAKPILARPELCHECGTCVEKCAPGALVMMVPGEPFPLVDRPDVDANYETGIGGSDGGLYVIGAAAGKPLVKNGINIGYWTIEHMMSKGLRAGLAKSLGFDFDVIIAGSGPAGLSAGLSAHDNGLSYVVLERSDAFAATIRGYPKGKSLDENPPPPVDPLRPEPGEVTKSGALWLESSTRERVLEEWERILAARRLAIRVGEPVEALESDGECFVVRTSKTSYRALRVVLAPGDRGDPRRLKVPGAEHPKVRYNLDDPDAHEGHAIMVVGGGNAAVEAAVALAKSGKNRVSIVYRKSTFARITPRNRNEIQALIEAGTISAHFKANPRSITGDAVVLACEDAAELTVKNDFVYCMLGADPPTAWLEKLGVRMVKKPADWEPGASDKPAFMQWGVP